MITLLNFLEWLGLFLLAIIAVTLVLPLLFALALSVFFGSPKQSKDEKIYEDELRKRK